MLEIVLLPPFLNIPALELMYLLLDTL